MVHRGRRGKDPRPSCDPIADTLRGKNKPEYTPHVDTGDFVVVVNAEKIAVTGKKLDDKMYYRHSGYPGGLEERTLREQLDRRPAEVLRKAVKGMLPRNRLGRAQIMKLKIYAGPAHPHEAQAPSRSRSLHERAGAVPGHRQAQDVGRPRDPPPGDGSWWINGRTLDDYFPRVVHRTQVVAPLKIAEAEGRYDVRIRVHGGGQTGQAGAVRTASRGRSSRPTRSCASRSNAKASSRATPVWWSGRKPA